MKSLVADDLMIRKSFLANVWKPYISMPTMDIDCTCGRITEINIKTGHLNLIDGLTEKVHQLNVQSWSIGPFRQESGPVVSPERILSVGDVVFLNSKSRSVLLLAPNLTAGYSFETAKRVSSWSHFKNLIRLFFETRNFQFIDTATLVSCPGTEPTLRTFETVLESSAGPKKFYLPTSPELGLKIMMAKGLNRIFEMRSCFRNAESGDHHLPEFWMLEWYRAYSNHMQICLDVEELVSSLCKDLSVSTPRFYRTTVQELFQKHLNYQLSPNVTQEELLNLNLKMGESPSHDDSISDLFFRLFVGHIEPKLNHDDFTFVSDYPAFQAAYSRINGQGWADRFECYWNGLEIGNCFHELNDPKLQMQRMQMDQEVRQQSGLASEFDLAEFQEALQLGLPPSGGIAIGLERLYMALTGLNRIQDIK